MDPSALIRAYLPDEDAGGGLYQTLFGGGDPLLTSEIARVEIAAAVRAAGRAGRLRAWAAILSRIDADLAVDGPVYPIAFRAEPVIATARQLVLDHKLRALDAIHLAVALEDGRALADGEALAFVTRDDDQATAARAVGLAVM
ncbi:MAG: type II toxin-antitoxin system VapC family toxin [Chloroflexota bacterium]|nr:type II toxin-antitoxin system VapC family toxin [Chloroflexota bacterium]